MKRQKIALAIIVATVGLSVTKVMAGASANNLISSISEGCGKRISNTGITNEQVRPLAECYQAGLDELIHQRLSPVGIAYKVCSKHSKWEFVRCMLDFSQSTQDADVLKLSDDCKNKTNGATNSNTKAEALYNCFRSGTQKYSHLLSEPKAANVSADTLRIADSSALACGVSINSTGISNDNVGQLADCYRSAMRESVKIEKTDLGIAVSICSSFGMNFEKVNCIERFTEGSQNPDLLKMIGACKGTPKTGLWTTAKFSQIDACLQEQAGQYPRVLKPNAAPVGKDKSAH